MDHATFPFNVKRLSETGQIAGFAAVYGNVDLADEILAPGCFAASLTAQRAEKRAPAMLLHHDMQRPVGRWETFTESTEGLFVEGRLTLTVPDGKEAYELLRDGALAGLSVGFANITSKRDGAGRRTIVAAELLEVSLVAVPANPKARVETVKAIVSVRDVEDRLREWGFSSRKAKAGATFLWRLYDQHEEPAANAKVAQMLVASTLRLRTQAGDKR